MFNYLKDFCTVTIVDFDTAFAQDDPDEKITYQRASGMGKDAAYLAPEVVEEEPCYGSKSDIWSAGVTLYKMLTNTLPFVRAETDDEQTIRRNILANPKVAFPENDWCGISEEAKDFVKFLMHPRPFERPSARQAVNHQWLSSARDLMTEVFDEKDSGAKKILHNMRKFNAADTKMKEAVCAYIASHLLTKEEIQPIDRVFKALDSQHDGKIRPYEIKQAFYRVYNKLISEKELKKIMTRIDLNGNGDLSYSEFSMAAVSREDLLSPPRLKMAFEMFDKQNKGYVTHDELRAAFRLVEMDMDYLNKIIKTVDKDGDGKISFAGTSRMFSFVFVLLVHLLVAGNSDTGFIPTGRICNHDERSRTVNCTNPAMVNRGAIQVGLQTLQIGGHEANVSFLGTGECGVREKEC